MRKTIADHKKCRYDEDFEEFNVTVNLQSPNDAVNSNTRILTLLAFPPVFFIFFPYLTTIPSGSDTQPNAIVLSSLFLLFFVILNRGNIRFTIPLGILFFIYGYSIFISLILDSFNIRSIVGYGSLAIMSFSTYLMVKRGLFQPRWLIYFIWIWLIVALIQQFVSLDFGNNLLIRSTLLDIGKRGVYSLATEPSFYGTMCIYMFMVLDILWRNNYLPRKIGIRYQVLLLAQALILAQSFTAVTLFSVYLGAAVISRFSFKHISRAVAIIAIIFYIVVSIQYFQNTRIMGLINLLSRTPTLLLERDESSRDRAYSIYAPLYGFYESLPLAYGHGTESYTDFLLEHADISSKLTFGAIHNGRIMSGMGSAFFELGFVGAMIPFLILYSFRWPRNHDMFVIGVFICVSMFAATPLAFPPLAFCLGLSEALRAR